MKQTLLTLIFVSSSFLVSAQNTLYQYFDGADTSASNSVFVVMDTSSANVWQIGPPQKTIFNSASTAPNALVTDTVNYYPANNISRCTFSYAPMFQFFGILAVQWRQKLDFDAGQDGGIIEFSFDHGQTWQNAFNNPNVYNFYGYNSVNADTLLTGEYAFSGTDTSWRDIWFCLDNSMTSMLDTVDIRLTLKSDSVNNQKEGWLIDNLLLHPTMMHTMKDGPQDKYMLVFPTIANDIVNIKLEKLTEYHIIEKIEVYDATGRLVKSFGQSPTKYWIRVDDLKEGMYYLKVTSNIKTATEPFVIKR